MARSPTHTKVDRTITQITFNWGHLSFFDKSELYIIAGHTFQSHDSSGGRGHRTDLAIAQALG